MIDVKGRELRPGMRVVLVSNNYYDGESNPRVGSSWECEGTVIAPTVVKWDNGHHNTYVDKTLEIIDDCTDGCVSIWN